MYIVSYPASSLTVKALFHVISIYQKYLFFDILVTTHYPLWKNHFIDSHLRWSLIITNRG